MNTSNNHVVLWSVYGLFVVKKYLFISECFSNKKIKQW